MQVNIERALRRLIVEFALVAGTALGLVVAEPPQLVPEVIQADIDADVNEITVRIDF